MEKQLTEFDRLLNYVNKEITVYIIREPKNKKEESYLKESQKGWRADLNRKLPTPIKEVMSEANLSLLESIMLSFDGGLLTSKKRMEDPRYKDFFLLLKDTQPEQKIWLIKIARNIFHCGLREAKDYIDKLWVDYPKITALNKLNMRLRYE